MKNTIIQSNILLIQLGRLHTLTYILNWHWGSVRNETLRQRNDFNFPIVNFSFICSNIPAVPAYGLYISQLIWNFRACGFYQDFLDRGLLLTKSSYWLIWSDHFEHFTIFTMTWLTINECLCHNWPHCTDMLHLSKSLPGHLLIHNLSLVCN
jgi:hypothetical protein